MENPGMLEYQGSGVFSYAVQPENLTKNIPKVLATDDKSAEYADIAMPYLPYSGNSKHRTALKSIGNSQDGNIIRIAASSHFTASIIPEWEAPGRVG